MKVHHPTPEAAANAGTEYFIGEVNVQVIVPADQGIDIVLVRFSPGARTYLHTHDVPQVLHCIEGTGILATETQRNTVHPGDIVHVPAGEMHWHGAAPDSHFVHLSIRPPGESHWTKQDPLA
ncbi:MAG: cupin domain-containing protein [Actinomycetota bacterium]